MYIAYSTTLIKLIPTHTTSHTHTHTHTHATHTHTPHSQGISTVKWFHNFESKIQASQLTVNSILIFYYVLHVALAYTHQ